MKKKDNGKSTSELIGIKGFSRNGFQTNGHGELVYFVISPTNISVMSQNSVTEKVRHLMQLLSAQSDIEIICTDACESFDENKLYLSARIESETNREVAKLLERDREFLDDIQIQMSTAREFAFVIRLRNESDEQSFSNLNRVEKLINEQGFDCRRAEKDDLKRMLSRYFGQIRIDKPVDDLDGESAFEQWIIED